MKKIGLFILAVFLVSPFFLGFTVTAKTTFKDISSKYWAKDEIDYLSTKKIINGYSNGNFGPNDSIKRVDAATMIVRALELDTSNRPNINLYDVTKKSYGYDTIATVIDEGIFFGNNGYFYPDNTLTRAEMAAILNRAFQLEEKNTKVSFKDLDTKYWAYKDIQALATNNITSGYEDNTFKPNQTITRAEFSAFMSRVLKNPTVVDDHKEPVVDPPETIENNGNGNTNNKDSQNFEVIQIY
ncbi:S-layer homology domain-containing protein [Niallia endozanthoxylica]|uniref:S-layer homology domain-containing protein n=1 Tax=Niallia endozanthoxylica TaxID=2036016 RepID=A0A5J5H467_9BACI|nr:S-layer homology domain-containing protein [Niallia endozanthoxylica]KAA9014563.1 S-layer homology domain-containing protein [Niallia endozanthoxylica]